MPCDLECNNKVTVALAAKLARIVWVVLTKPGATYGSHQGLAATAVHSREAGYIYADCYRRNLKSLQ